ncbi:MAG TPA: NAD(P)/FAD-dependent oxidoreductase [Terriglobales bacterium]|nr:NAD(P)/FAD-dependent oxidoreductase [Terriglobales bacterium]
MRSVAVIGGGPAGLMAAGTAAARGLDVTLYEKNKFPGRKLLITGKGRCNVTTACAPEEFLNYVTGSPKFLHSALAAFSCEDTRAFFEEQGVPLKVERGERVFPASDRSVDIRDALVRYAKAGGVKFVRKEIDKLPKADAVIIATGGLSYPLTGSTGDGYRFAREAGHEVVPPRPSLVPLVCAEDWCRQLEGLSLRNVRLTVFGEGKKSLFSEQGELLFTDFGISGPLTLSASTMLRGGTYKAEIDLKPALSIPQLDARVLRDFKELQNRDFANALGGLLPKSLIPVVVALCAVAPETKVNSVKKQEREGLVSLLKALPLTVTGTRPIEEAIVTAGGVPTREVDPKTMESKLKKGLYFAGEVLDLDAMTGGFNLQIAFSTGRLAGMSV